MEFLTILVIAALIATVVAMGMGVVSMGRGGDYDDKHSGQFMEARVAIQGVAVVLLLGALFFALT